MSWIDSHCHLQDQYRPDSATVFEVAAEAEEAQVCGLVCVGTDAANSDEAMSLVEILRSATGPGAEAFGAWSTVGLHPHDASQGVPAIEEIERVIFSAARERPGTVVAVGECGLDYHYENSPRATQREAFCAQIELARRYELTLVVHSRDAWEDTIDILGTERAPERVVLHCFTGGPDEARRCLDLGAFLSFSGIITFKNAGEVREALRLCPADRLLVETDAPFLAPAPHRGEPNRPAWVSLVGEAAAKVRSSPVEELSAATLSATREAFALG